MNIAEKITEISNLFPDKKSVVLPIRNAGGYLYRSLTFRELENKINSYSYFLSKNGFKRGQKTLLFVRPSLEFHALVFALFKIGVVPILIDPGMGLKNLKIAIKKSKPDAMIAEPILFLLKIIFRDTFSSIKNTLSTRSLSFLSNSSLSKCLPSTKDYPAVDSEEAAILFTSGGTGTPKGVVYSQKIFSTQTKILKEMFHLNENEVDLAGFPLFSLFTLSMGMTSIIPDMNPSKPKDADPKALVQNINDQKATFLAGSPAIWENLLHYCKKNKIKLPSVKYLVMFGAPVRNYIHEGFREILPNGTTYTPYGATESLPVSNISGTEILNETAHMTDTGFGTCVGAPAPGIEIKIIDITDEQISKMEDTSILPAGEIGEIIVSGDVVTREYLYLEKETALAKIADAETFWHRMGDLGYFDSAGRLWFCGRKSHRVELEEGMLCPIPCEAIFNQHPDVARTALVGPKRYGPTSPIIIVERKNRKKNKKHLTNELLKLGQEHPHTEMIKEILYCDHFPVDVRHNIKIDRTQLKNRVERSSR